MSLATESDKWIRIIADVDPKMTDAMENMKNDELKARVLQSQMNLLENERAKKSDDKLAKAKQKYDEAKGPYDDAKKFQNAIVQYGMLLLEERGVPLSDEE